MNTTVRSYSVLLILSSFILIYTKNSSEPQQNPLPSPVHINIVNHGPSTSNNQQMETGHYSITTTKNQVIQKTSNKFFSQFSTYMQSFDPQVCKQNSIQWLKNNKYTILTYGMISCYVGVWIFLLSYDYYFDRTDLWSTWKAETPFTQLCTKPTKLLHQELLFEIQRRYLNQQNPIDFVSPLAAFMKQINREEESLDHLTMLINWLDRCHCSWLFLRNEEHRKKVENHQQRLSLVKQLFLSWAAEHNINQKESSLQNNNKNYFATNLK